MRAVRALLLLLFALPTAGASVTIEALQTPERTAADHPFDVAVELRNDGPARTVHLFGALYDPQDGGSPCGSAADPRFRTFTHVVQEAVELPARSTTTHPAPGERWLHRYQPEDAAPAPEEAQFCVFVANASSGPLIDYEAFRETTLSVRARNAPPFAAFTVETAEPRVSAEVAFLATATDEEGDPVSFAWDFGHHTAAGRAVAEGPNPRHAFYPAGDYLVTLVATDGLDETRVSHLVNVASGAASPVGEKGIPLGAGVAALSLVVAVLLSRRDHP